jgi:hypothetical protein
MVCTQARGGMRSVVEAYERDGLFQRWRFKSLRTHLEGSALARITIALRAYIEMLCLLSMGRVSFMHVHAAMRGSFWRKSFFARIRDEDFLRVFINFPKECGKTIA